MVTQVELKHPSKFTKDDQVGSVRNVLSLIDIICTNKPNKPPSAKQLGFCSACPFYKTTDEAEKKLEFGLRRNIRKEDDILT